MPKLAIYVPKKDMRVIEKWRKRINFSKVFMRALSQEIRDRNRVVTTDDDKLGAAAAYYKRKLTECSDVLVDSGYDLGTSHVIECQLSPELIQRLLKLGRQQDWNDDDLAFIEEAVGDRMAAIDALLDKHGYDAQARPTWRKVVYQGYLNGVAAAWQKVCEHM